MLESKKDQSGVRPPSFVLRDNKDLIPEGIEKLDAGQINAADDWGVTPLHLAAEAGHSKEVKLLISKLRADHISFACKDGSTALHLAAQNGHHTVVEMLIDSPLNAAQLNVVDQLGRTALHWAADEGHKQVVEVLIKKPRLIQIDAVDNIQRTALHWAAVEGHHEVVEILIHLLQAGELNAKDLRGKTALQLAKENSHTKVVEVFTQADHIDAVGAVSALYFLGVFLSWVRSAWFSFVRGLSRVFNLLNQSEEAIIPSAHFLAQQPLSQSSPEYKSFPAVSASLSKLSFSGQASDASDYKQGENKLSPQPTVPVT